MEPAGARVLVLNGDPLSQAPLGQEPTQAAASAIAVTKAGSLLPPGHVGCCRRRHVQHAVLTGLTADLIGRVLRGEVIGQSEVRCLVISDHFLQHIDLLGQLLDPLLSFIDGLVVQIVHDGFHLL